MARHRRALEVRAGKILHRELDFLEVGEEEFLRHANLCKRHGAAVVAMAFDKQGRAATLED